MPTALITGASAGLGRALAGELAARRWRLIIDGRRQEELASTAAELTQITEVTAIAGDVADRDHRRDLIAAVQRHGGLDLLVNNASTLGPTPLRPLAQTATAELAQVVQVNVLAPFALIRALLPAVERAAGVVLNISSDAAVEHYPAWGPYGAAKASLDHLTATLAAEQESAQQGQRERASTPGRAARDIRFYAVDPGDMNTALQQAAFPGEDVSDRRSPAEVVPALIELITHRPPSGRYRAGDGAVVPDPSTRVAVAW
ncbi:MAG TPA: SDR family NAD(P)-dependent oxidoreductase [Nakamurella sp.]|nr:SDR family NAD(P)-dependent oxidoreductase [Nakamurella sp.]